MARIYSIGNFSTAIFSRSPCPPPVPSKKIKPNIPDTDRIRQGGEASRILDDSSPTEIPPPLNTAKIVSIASRSAARKQRTLLQNDEVVDGSVVFNGSFPPYLIW